MFDEIVDYIRKELKAFIERRGNCRHEGETHDFCGKCGADLRVVTGYQCRFCELSGGNSTYSGDACPDFCTSCGAPKFTFRALRKRRNP
jgi:hypothetical protein